MPDWQTMRALLAGVPDLPGARCKGSADLFEATVAEHDKTATRSEVQQSRAVALRICAACPARTACGDWLASLPLSRRPRGVVAGEVITANGLPAATGGDSQ